ncbi:alpha/beta hydrolase [Actinopolymorpha singaporensis]|uniref:S-formylglutathione hydrolase FrmB n=1 Tax=Actinopolymorpha singaporensis TaxID=117157 RepID=A0A1H1MEM3_9ACTN|nr:alpha/beta hydrolase family protein [Actinopolymorpha singaporensis]SDR85042.1 S-formylglutathione hydrolase FrmB [Actinopolymorpha singaporensis]
MALMRCDFFSEALELSTSMTVILPQETSTQIGMSGAARAGGAPVLYLLHGLSDDDTIWLRRTSIERYVSTLGLAVVMPAVHRSFYADEAHGNRYWTFLSEELPSLVDHFFKVSTRRQDTFVAGLSMGGYGAVKWALRQPERFAAAASLSGALDVANPGMRQGRPELMDRVFGEDVRGTDNDLLWLLEQAAKSGRQLPALHVSCGTEDHLLAHNHAFVDTARRLDVPVTVEYEPGEHEWGLWDRKIQDVLRWLPLS